MNVEKLDIYFWAWLVVGAFIMYFVYIVVDPTYEILDKQNQVLEYQANQTKLAIEQNDEIIENQNNNTQEIQDLVIQSRANQEEAISYIIRSMNQSNIIGNKTGEDIQRNIDRVGELQQNLSDTRKAQSEGIVKGFSYLLEDLDEDSDDFREILEKLAIKENITLSEASLSDEFKIQSENQTFVFPNGTETNLRDLFVPASYGSGLDIGTLNLSADAFSVDENNDEVSGNISGFLGGPMILNESIPKGILDLNMNITANQTANKSRP